MAPAVPFALLGVVQLLAVAGWVGLGGAALFPRLRRRVTPLFVVGALALAAADALTAVQFGSASSSGIGWLRVAGFALIALGAAVAGWRRGRRGGAARRATGAGVRRRCRRRGRGGRSLAARTPPGRRPGV